MPAKALVLDANILIRAALGNRARSLIETHFETASFFGPDAAMAEAEEHLSALTIRRGGDPEKAVALLRSIGNLLEMIGIEVYGEFETAARERLDRRDPDDWPVLAPALALRCSIWTEDTDFSGCGVATWTSDRVRLYLND